MVQSLPGFLDLCLDVCSPCQVLWDVYTEVLEAAHPLHRGPTDHKRSVGPLLSLPEVHDQLFSFAHVQRETVVLAPWCKVMELTVNLLTVFSVAFLQKLTVKITFIFTVYPLSTLPFLRSDYKKKNIMYYPTWCLNQLTCLLLYTSCNFKSIRSFHTEIWVSIAASQFAYLYYP